MVFGLCSCQRRLLSFGLAAPGLVLAFVAVVLVAAVSSQVGGNAANMISHIGQKW